MNDIKFYLEYFARHGLLEEGEERIIGETSSPFSAIKIAFDGYGSDDEGEEDENFESYVIYIHKDAAKDRFKFPQHESNGFHVVHRPKEEAYVYFWYDVEKDVIEVVNYEDTIGESELTLKKVTQILRALHKKYKADDNE